VVEGIRWLRGRRSLPRRGGEKECSDYRHDSRSIVPVLVLLPHSLKKMRVSTQKGSGT
jgi:hypothetical protein